ncbi:DUF930 domain-containing protein [Ancylobacter sp. A5.8]|uniref:DUF930 domain-containing protein n=1 Tax=Ancylobacter gelatini TaxID=2919920 RepID=UPI001F4D8BBA|nr:DUF930 domain-containing protein [Ancylobacter gelatini]MCJ8142498.1 DUF930 domain-containing protein [Ancylobacter gelatini]
MTGAAAVPIVALAADERLPVMAALCPRAQGTLRLALSLALHVALLLVMLWLGLAPVLPPEPPAVTVEILSGAAFDALRAPAPPTVPMSGGGEGLGPPSAAPPAAVPPVTTRPDGMIHPSTLLSQQALAQPANRPLRRQLATLADEEHIAQLCDLEAMEQIHAWKGEFQPDRLVDYALSDPRLEEGAFIAHGAAFRAGHQWYELSYRCELDASRRRVTGFSFRVGAAIAREEWSALNLPAVH